MGINLIFILALVVASGFVAWAGDVLGRVMGKRRVSLLGLRPRRTSVLIGVVTGMLITCGTIIALVLADKDIRYALERMGEIREQITALVGERDSLTVERDEARQQNDNLQTSIYQTELAIEDLAGQLSTAHGELAGMRSEVTQLQTEIAHLESERTGLQKTVGASEARVVQLEGRIAERESRLASLNKEIEAKNVQIENLSGQVRTYETGEVRVSEGQELVVIPIDTRQTIDRIYDELWLWINAIPGNYKDPATGQLVLADNEIDISSEAYVQALDEIRALSSDLGIVIVYATSNIVENRPVPVRLQVTSNYKVFSQGSLIYSAVFNAPAAEAQDPYSGTIARFLEDARDHLIGEKSLIPSTSGEILQIPAQDLIKLSGDLAGVGFPAELRIVALTDIYRADTEMANIFRANLLEYNGDFGVLILPAAGSE